MIIAIDFDGTVVNWRNYPFVGAPLPYALETIKDLKALGHTIILNTVRCRDSLELAKNFFDGHGIQLDGYNVLDGQRAYSHSPKINADVFIDDKGLGCPLDKNGYVDWLKVREYFEL